MNKIFYVVTKEVDDEGYLTGNKCVTAYKIAGNDLTQVIELVIRVSDNSKNKLNHWLERNEYPDCELVQLN